MLQWGAENAKHLVFASSENNAKTQREKLYLPRYPTKHEFHLLLHTIHVLGVHLVDKLYHRQMSSYRVEHCCATQSLQTFLVYVFSVSWTLFRSTMLFGPLLEFFELFSLQ